MSRNNGPYERATTAVPGSSEIFDLDDNSGALDEGWSLCDIKRQQLREMFPNCPANVLIEASERLTLNLAVDHVMNHLSSDASMYYFVCAVLLYHAKYMRFFQY